MKKETRCVTDGAELQHPGVVQPIDPSTAFFHIDGDSQPYPRYFNTPNQLEVAQQIADLERAEAGMLFSSGMAAISSTLTALLQPGEHVILQAGLYGGSQAYMNSELEARQISKTIVDKRPESFAAAMQESTSLIYLESPTNPTLDIVDLVAIVRLAKQHNVLTVIDNTFASPINQNPIEHGIDVVLHSGTKYLGGHSDLCCGAVATSHAILKKIHKKSKLYGGSLNALSVYLLGRSLKTLDVRVRRQTANAATLAEYLKSHDSVQLVYYPGLESHAGHAIAQRQMHDFGAMIAFELTDDIELTGFLRRLRVARPALSLGGVETTVCIPATTSHRDIPMDQLAAVGVTPSLIRLSVGIEHVDDLIEDFDQAITAAGRAKQAAGESNR